MEAEKNAADLMAFGYTCRIFSDDEKATEIVNGAYLVPWNGEKDLMIDRFDCRGYLSNVAEYDSLNVKSCDFTKSEDELQIEIECDRERYLDLVIDVQEEEILNEEERKRYDVQNKKAYGAVEFSYNNSAEQKEDNNEIIKAASPSNSASSEEDVPYELPIDLPMPQHIVLPTSEKEAVVIEKTAYFIAKQGAQMEIVLKTKQAGNALFKFLDHGHVLNSFYKELVQLIKTGIYIPKLRHTQTNESEPPTEVEMKLPKVDISQTSYAALINKFKPKVVSEEVAKKEVIEVKKEEESTEVKTPNAEDKWQQKYREYYEHYYQYYYTHYYGTLGSTMSQPALVEKAANDAAVAAMAAVDAIKKAESASTDIESLRLDMTNGQKVIIDKMADYVVRNGIEFESIVFKQKGSDPLFLFLQPTHKYHAYYLAKRRSCLQEVENEENEKKTDKVASPEQKTEETEKEEKESQSSGDEESDDEYALHPLLTGAATGVDVSSEDVTIPGDKKDEKKEQVQQVDKEITENPKPSAQDKEKSQQLEKFHRKLDDHMQATKRKQKRKSSPSSLSNNKTSKRSKSPRSDSSSTSLSSDKEEEDSEPASNEKVIDRMKERRLKAAQLVARLNASNSNPVIPNVEQPVPENVPAAVAAALSMNGNDKASKTEEFMKEIMEERRKRKSGRDKSRPSAYSKHDQSDDDSYSYSRKSKKSKKERRSNEYSERRSRKEKKSRRRSRS